MSDNRNSPDHFFYEKNVLENFETIKSKDPEAGTYDYIIIGAGSAGCVIARRLLDSTDARVLLLEAGGSHIDIASVEAPNRWPENLNTPYDYAYQYEPASRLNNRPISINRGKLLGGSGSINFMVWGRGDQADYNGWAAAGNKGWDYQSVLPLFKKIEDWEEGETDFHGAGGPIGVKRAKNIHIAAQAFLESGKSYGMPYLEDTNSASPEGVGISVMNVKHGVRSSPATGYLDPVIYHKNLTVLTYAKVLKLNFEGTRCVGVDFTQEDKSYTVRATKEVVLSAGAIDSPRILMLSGIGDPADLKEIGIAPFIDLPGVGKNLQDHVMVQGLCFETKDPLAPYNNNLTGTTAHWKSRADLKVPDLMIICPQIPVITPEIAALYPPAENCFALLPCLVDVKSRGYLKMKSAKHDGPLEIQPNFLADPADLEAMISGVEIGMDLISQPAFRKVIKKYITPEKFENRQAIVDFIKNAATTYFHTVGTCAMGSGTDAVVNDELQVYGVSGLRVADASIMPQIPRANTHAITLMIGEFAAELMLKA